MKILAIIPARGGSKGLPEKNIRLLSGHPLISYSILAAQKSKNINRIIVTTDSQKIAKISEKYGAEVPFIRPANLAEDSSKDLEVFQHALNYLEEKENYIPDLVVQLRPTSPLRFLCDIDNCIDLLVKNVHADSIRAVTEAPLTPYKMWKIKDSNSPMEPLLKLDNIPEPYNESRHTLPKVYWQVGMIDVIKTSIINENNSMSGDTILPYIISKEYSVDIDNVKDFENAEILIKNLNCIKF